jgi:tyrosyl-tRNA synthetase
MNLSNVKFLWASDEINSRAEEYWSRVMDISRKSNITRIKKCCTIMGRGEGDDMPTS